jgi:hypothetical protein
MPADAIGSLALIEISKRFGLVDAAQTLLQPRLQLLAHLLSQPRLQLLAHLPHELAPFFKAAGLGLGSPWSIDE